jgi:hypothetical protein
MQEWCDNHISMTTTTTKLAWKMEAWQPHQHTCKNGVTTTTAWQHRLIWQHMSRSPSKTYGCESTMQHSVAFVSSFVQCVLELTRQ